MRSKLFAKKTMALTMAALMAMGALAGCGSKSEEPAPAEAPAETGGDQA